MGQLPPPPGEPLGSPAAPNPAKPRRWPIIVIAIGAVVLVLAVAGAVVASSGGGSSSASPSATASPSAAPPSAPAGLHAAAGAFTVKLTWHTGAQGGAPVTRYDIRRNGSYVGQTDGNKTTFTDDDTVPGQHYQYTVAAVGEDESKAVASVAVKTKSAPPGTAALVGTFNVHLHNTSNSGFASFTHTDFNNGWRFVPLCDHPPCATQLRNINQKSFIVKLKQNGGSYTGSASASGFSTCQGHDVTSNFTVTIHATAAGAVNGTWQVTKFAGTFAQSASAQLGCTSTSANFTVAGTALKH
jgi:hypothetical protein